MRTNARSKEIENILVEDIRPNPYQPRQHFNQAAIEELAMSIKNYGILQPLNVRKIGEKNFELVVGERRLRAAKHLGLTTIPAIVIEVIDQDAAILALIENIQREDLNYLEEATSYNYLINEHGLTQEDLAKKVGKTQSSIANKVRLLRLSEDIKKLLMEHSLSERHARALLGLPDEKTQRKVLKKIVEKNMTVKKAEELVKKTREKLLQENTVEQKKQSRTKMKSYIDFKIYTNTVKNAVQEIKNSGINATYEEESYENYIEIKIRLPKK